MMCPFGGTWTSGGLSLCSMASCTSRACTSSVGTGQVVVEDRQELYFARLHELGDPWEGARPLRLAKRLVEMVGESGPMYDYYRIAASQAVVSCWHENEYESVAMWRLYTSGSEGVAVKTTIGRLKRSLAGEPRAITIGRVQYIDHIDHGIDDDGLAPEIDTLSPIFCKRRSFEHEREVRVVIAVPDERELRNAVAQIPPALGQASAVSSSLGDRGLAVPVDMPALVKNIVVSPQFPPWAMEALQRVVDRSGLAVGVEPSDLLKRPVADLREM